MPGNQIDDFARFGDQVAEVVHGTRLCGQRSHGAYVLKMVKFGPSTFEMVIFVEIVKCSNARIELRKSRLKGPILQGLLI